MHKDVVCEQLKVSASQQDRALSLIEKHCERMPQTYFNQFSLPDIRLHLDLVQKLLDGDLLEYQWSKMAEVKCFELILVAYDYSWLMVALTGYLALYGFDIRTGHVFTYREAAPSDEQSYYEQRKKVVDVLEVVYEGSSDDVAKAQKAFEDDLKAFFYEVDAHKLNEFRLRLMRQVGEFLEKQEVRKQPLFPIDIDVDIDSGAIMLAIKGKDTPFFLFTLSLALSTQNIEIVEIAINTQNDHVEDILTVHDRSGRLSKDVNYLNCFKVVVALVKHFTYLLPLATDYHKAFHHFELFIDKLLKSDESMDDVMQWHQSDALGSFAAIFGSGSHMWEQFLKIQHKTFGPFFRTESWAVRSDSFEEDYHELSERLKDCKDTDTYVDQVNQFKDSQLFQLDMCHLVYPHYSFRDFGSDLSRLAQNVLILMAQRLYQDICQAEGMPQFEGHECGYALMRLGKWGGDELGYASDLEMIMIYEGYGWTDSKSQVSNQEFFNLLMQKIKESVHVKAQGIFELDLRLRPDGQKGPLSTSFKRWNEYYQKGQAHAYEVQSLVKMDHIYGLRELIEQILQSRDDIVYADENIPLQDLLDLRMQQKDELVKPGHINAKFSLGGLVDIEYAVQMLQMKHGAKHPSVRTPRTLKAMGRLLEEGLLKPSDYEHISNAYSFFRRLINALRMVRGHAKDLLVPALDSDEFLFLARRMKYKDQGQNTMKDQLQQDITDYMNQVQRFFNRSFVDDEDVSLNEITVSDLVVRCEINEEDVHKVLEPYGFSRVIDVYKSMRRTYQLVEHRNHFIALLLMVLRQLEGSPDPDRVIFNFEHLFSKSSVDLFRECFYDPKVLDLIIAVFGHSEFLSQILIQDPLAMDEVFQMESRSAFQNRQELEAEWEAVLREHADIHAFFDTLRQFRNRVILRIGMRDFFARAEFIRVIQEVSELADMIIDLAFKRILLEHNVSHLYDAQVIIALGKMGGKELNYSSDIDLLFAIHDDVSEDDRQTLLKVSQELITHIMASSPYFQLYRIDMRLRPHGISGSLVVKKSVYQKYCKKEAHGWELQAWVKARPIAGATRLGESLVKAFQELLFEPDRRDMIYASMDKMRNQKIKMLEKEGTLERDVKSGLGGIRSIEFYLQRLQVKWASKYPDLVSGHSLYVLGCLAQHNIVDPLKVQVMHNDYIFLRRIEHCLQLLGMQQTHLMPENDIELLKLAKRMGYADVLETTAQEFFLRDFHDIWERVKALGEESRD